LVDSISSIPSIGRRHFLRGVAPPGQVDAVIGLFVAPGERDRPRTPRSVALARIGQVTPGRRAARHGARDAAATRCAALALAPDQRDLRELSTICRLIGSVSSATAPWTRFVSARTAANDSK
jgi:hypothetical protein